jgi:hypothetical protein
MEILKKYEPEFYPEYLRLVDKAVFGGHIDDCEYFEEKAHDLVMSAIKDPVQRELTILHDLLRYESFYTSDIDDTVNNLARFGVLMYEIVEVYLSRKKEILTLIEG